MICRKIVMYKIMPFIIKEDKLMKKRIFSVLLAVLMVVLMLPVQAFAATEEIKGAYVGTNFETAIGSALGATKFSKSGNIPEGLKISGKWVEKHTFGDYVLTMFISGTPTKAGTYNFSVSYLKDDNTAVKKVNYTMTIGEEAPYDYVKSINLDKWPNKTVYYLGDTIDLTGMKVTALVYKYDPDEDVYEPIENYDITDMCWVEPSVFTSDEAQTVDVFFKGPCNANGDIDVLSDHFRVDFKYADPNTIMRMEIYQKPTKLTYTVGETLDTTGMTVRLHKGDGSAQDVTTGFKTDVTTLSEVGTKTVTVTYGEGDKMVSATFDVTVNEKVEEPVSSSSSSSVPESSVSSSSEPEPSSESSSEEELPVESESSSSEEELPVESESSSSEEEIIVIGDDVEGEDEDEGKEKGGIPFWVWIIIGLLVILIAAAVALFIIGRKRIDD